ncbi:MAG: bifunctional pyr operon transcriptional regulator/uracil phosphoribosyltransferase PyrR [Rhodothermales bacterium]|nr:bifunctional pyr operon transcriptional regulator/uracil phosphoribosyltransferase PyrR [Rhodothermales bacterium]MBO6781372.1 bifunctional pyr operon transcriptional regulator/uracil phosphoribosyltransferase PyrR [Rhodothermales bacterium]
MESGDVVKAQLLDERDLGRTLDRMAQQIVEHVPPGADAAATMALVGMQSRGVHLARRIHDRISTFEGIDIPLGVLDATMYRDDFRLRLKQPVIRETRIPFDLSERQVFLVDDVLYTGRTVRAALDALMDLGRPSAVHFMAIVDRGLRELPIRADIVGRHVPTFPGEEVRVRLKECDGMDGVWLVENPKAGGGR